MGRPTKKSNFGNVTDAAVGERLVVTADIGAGNEQCWISAQKGVGKFIVYSVDGGATPTRSGVVKLQDAAPSAEGQAQLDVFPHGSTGGASGAELSVTSLQLQTPTVVTTGAGYVIADTITLAGGTSTVAATFDVNDLSTVAGQTEADFSVFVGGDGAGGTAAVALDVYTMDDGSTVRVDSIDGSDDVLTFTVLTASTSGIVGDNQVVSFASLLSGTGNDVSFTMTMETATQGVFDVVDNAVGTYTVIPASPAAHTGGTGTGCTLTVDGEIKVIGIDDGGTGFTASSTVNVGGVTGDIIAVTVTAGVIDGITYTNRGSGVLAVANTNIDVESATAEHVRNLTQYNAKTFDNNSYKWKLGEATTEGGEGYVQSINLSD